MGVTFIGNPFDQDEEYDDSDWDMNAVEEWIMPPQEVAFLDPVRAFFDPFPAPEFASSDSDEDYVPEEDEDDFENNMDPFFYGSNEEGEEDEVEEEEEEEELDYVTYPLRGENDSDPDKSSSPEENDTD